MVVWLCNDLMNHCLSRGAKLILQDYSRFSNIENIIYMKSNATNDIVWLFLDSLIRFSLLEMVLTLFLIKFVQLITQEFHQNDTL